jgi:bifunctional UDP-N-acetylglucosamine pyrophosphorylase/glucosamine-1-phosphate N-acetyltransferase
MRIKGKAIDSGRKKLGAVIGDDVSTGINVNLMPGVKIGAGAQIGPGVTLYRDLPTGVKVLRQTTTVQKPKSRQARRI